MESNGMAVITSSLVLPGREELHLHLEVDADGQIMVGRLRAIGGPDFLQSVGEYRKSLRGRVADLRPPKEKTVAGLLLRELVLRAKGEWNFPFCEPELCHCRAVPTRVVDQAILSGAHTPEEVSRLTSASTACGTCRPDVVAMIAYRLGSE